jgi:hypothetical protein
MVESPAGCRKRVIMGGREGVFRRQAIVDGQDPDAGSGAEAARVNARSAIRQGKFVDAAFLVFNCASIKQRSLLKGLVVLKICDVETHLDYHADNFLNFCLLYFLKKLLVKRVAACIKSWLAKGLLILVLFPHCHVFVLHLLILRSFMVLKTKLHGSLTYSAF